jgi:hypothetical protein
LDRLDIHQKDPEKCFEILTPRTKVNFTWSANATQRDGLISTQNPDGVSLITFMETLFVLSRNVSSGVQIAPASLG